MAEEIRLMLEGQEVPVKVRRNARAKRMILRVCSRTGDVRLTLPGRHHLHIGHALHLLRQQGDKGRPDMLCIDKA